MLRSCPLVDPAAMAGRITASITGQQRMLTILLSLHARYGRNKPNVDTGLTNIPIVLAALFHIHPIIICVKTTLYPKFIRKYTNIYCRGDF